ncbi:MAG: DUF2156 domain-containing protein [Thermoplasmatales archaeon]|nr:MAG: DUF2156 domain-containing protein [Thermoplasmatales archaeon]
MLSIDDFQPVTLDDKQIFDQHYAKYPPTHSDNVFTTLISWKDYAKCYYAFLNDNLIIMIKIEGNFRFRPPIGKRDKDLFRQVLKLAKKEASDYPFGLIDVQTKDWLSKNFPNLKFISNRDYFDYVYLTSDLAELPGTAYGKIRNRLNKFMRNFAYTIEKISKENMDDIRKFLKRWCLWKDCESDPLLESERKAILYSMANFFELELSGLAIRIDGNIEAISVFERMSPNTAVVHYEKGSPDYDGIYKAINAEAAKLLQKDFKFINREPDMGLPGLRKAKMSYCPHHMIEVFHVDKQNMVF